MAIIEINFALHNVNFVLSDGEELYNFEVTKEQLINIHLDRHPACSELNHHQIFDQYNARLFQIAHSKIAANLSESVVISITSDDYFGKE